MYVTADRCFARMQPIGLKEARGFLGKSYCKTSIL